MVGEDLGISDNAPLTNIDGCSSHTSGSNGLYALNNRDLCLTDAEAFAKSILVGTAPRTTTTRNAALGPGPGSRGR